MKKELKFSGYFMTVNNEQISVDKFKSAIPDGDYHEQYDSAYYTFSFEYSTDYLFIPISHGSPLPLPDNVINTDTKEKEANPRSSKQYEPKQDFAIIDFNTGYIWISNIYRKIIFQMFFVQMFKTIQVTMKEVYNEADFVKAIRKIDEIRFAAVPNLFGQTGSLSAELINEIHGYGAATAIIHMKYQDTLISGNIIDKIINIFKSKNAFKSIMIAGKDANNINMIFNSEVILRKLVVKSELNTNGTFNEKDIFDKLKIQLNKA